ncbi:nucleoside triphosphate pyrophosphohydrolase [Pistricoccus aurantiacus]|uniref:nucleoside triphosphate pyrophosphohydrolase n=1 Tax=Pistricoccus aurantiacus TaxID=1883414 RepID=UPI001FEA3B98|nr:nucleoside triphosphate pyrophosphohydrolase [Pistricoccus aurantiacus]
MNSGITYTLDDLLTLMAVLRNPREGCPWDQRQDWDSIVPHTLEEAYEVADAIERRAFEELPGELGDLLFQVVYYCQFGVEEQRFDFHQVVHLLVAKMLRRHPHVFPDGTLGSRREESGTDELQVKQRWEALKAQEREARQANSILDDVPRTLPALSRAAKLSRRAAQVGFDWPDARGVIAKIREELAEVEEALEQRELGQVQARRVQEEIGDLLFAVTNLARHQGADPEQCLRGTNEKFERRFRYVETAHENTGRGLSQASFSKVRLAEMEAHWQAAKSEESL